MDIQGVELAALRSAGDLIQHADAIYAEVNTQEVYKGCGILSELDSFLESKGFKREMINMTGAGWGDALFVRCSSKSCYVTLMGGLGNQLFQIAAGYAHARRTDQHIIISNRTLGERPNYWQTFLHKLADKTVATAPTGLCRWDEPHFHYREIPREKTAIQGYFQSSRYFTDVSGEVRELFDPHPDIKSATAEKYRGVLTEEGISAGCVVHIRRTDYLQSDKIAFHVVCDKAWYARALAEMDRRRRETGLRTQYLVFSDDLDWCQAAEQADLWAGRDVVFVDEKNDCMALHLMSQFRAFVISNSSFSWWATWLQPTAKTVIAPNRWFGRAGPQDWQDIYEPGWIQLP